MNGRIETEILDAAIQREGTGLGDFETQSGAGVSQTAQFGGQVRKRIGQGGQAVQGGIAGFHAQKQMAGRYFFLTVFGAPLVILLDQMESELSFHGLAHRTLGQVEGSLLEFGNHATAGEPSQIAAIVGVAHVFRVVSGQIFEASAGIQLVEDEIQTLAHEALVGFRGAAVKLHVLDSVGGWILELVQVVIEIGLQYFIARILGGKLDIAP